MHGKDGTMGARGPVGPTSNVGPKGPAGSKGEKGTQASQKNWKQCAWSNLSDGRDNGLIKVIAVTISGDCLCFRRPLNFSRFIPELVIHELVRFPAQIKTITHSVYSFQSLNS